MKKLVHFAVVFMLLASLAACGKPDDVEHLGNNFKIVDIDYDKMMLTVEDMGIPPIVEGEIYIQCEDVPIIYCDYEKADDPKALQELEFTDMAAGDEIIVNSYQKDLEKLKDKDSNRILKITQIQLGTQRLN